MAMMRLHAWDCFLKLDGAAGFSVVRAGVDGYCSSECTHGCGRGAGGGVAMVRWCVCQSAGGQASFSVGQ